MRFFRYFALAVLLLDLPIPIYWFILHPFSGYWRRHVRAAFWTAVLGAWLAGGIFMAFFWDRWLAAGSPSALEAVIGVALIALDLFILYRADRDLGHLKLVGHAELTGKMELTTVGIYKHVRHPRYTGMILAVIGACFFTGTRWSWIVTGIWVLSVLVCIFLEERELHHRFGLAYDEYSRAVPRFFPRVWNS